MSPSPPHPFCPPPPSPHLPSPLAISTLWSVSVIYAYMFLYVFDSFTVNFGMLCEVKVQFNSFACGYPGDPSFVEKLFFSSLTCLCIFVENHLTINADLGFSLSTQRSGLF